MDEEEDYKKDIPFLQWVGAVLVVLLIAGTIVGSIAEVIFRFLEH